MYSRPFPPSPRDLPDGYGGETFSPPSEPDPVRESEERREGPPAVEAGKRSRSRLSSLLPGVNWREFLSGDLIILAVAILMLLDNGDDCEEEDNDLWLLLLLLYFMK